jgi:hypothetical protein
VQVNEIVAEAMPLLTAAVSAGAGMAQGVATRVLGDMAADWLKREGQEDAWLDFTSNPQNDLRVRQLLQQALVRDPEFRARFFQAVQAAAAERTWNSGRQAISIGGSGEAQIGDRGDTIHGSRVATRGSSYHEGDVYNEGDRVTNKKGNPAGLVALVVGILIFIGVVGALIKGVPALLHSTQNAGLTASSTCQQFLNTDEQTEQQALVNIAMSKGIGGFGSPLALPEIRYECSSEPTKTLGDLIERDKGSF